MTTARRRAELVAGFSDEDQALFEDALPTNVAAGADKSGRYFKVVSSEEMTGEAAETHLEYLWVKCAPFLALIHEMNLKPADCVLRVVQYVSADDDIGPGIPVERKWVAALARLGGELDIDIYVN
jgi:hypothetical protein